MDSRKDIFFRKRKALAYDGSIGDAIAKVRYKQQLRQGDVADAFGCEQPLISKLEAGQRSLKFSELPALSRALGVSRDELVKELLEALDRVDSE